MTPITTSSPAKERDSETGLDYFGARYYSNGLGRWVSADWSSTPIPVPYADFGDPQSLNLYGFVGGNPASKADPDGHCCSLSEVADFVGGVSQGIVASASFGAVGAPRSSDSTASLWGQAAGTIIEGATGTVIRDAGAATVGVGLVAEAPSAGTSTAVVVTGAAGVLAGGTMEAGAAKNVGGILNAMSAKNSSDSTLQPGPHAGEGTPASGPEPKFTPEERNAVNQQGQSTGCHTCGATNPGTKSGNHIPDHQPPSKLNPNNQPQRLYPHCQNCSRKQGGEVKAAKAKQAKGE
jgi:RHS repeat-associated protein